MTAYDAAMAGVILAGMVWGAWRGITWQLASIASLVLGYAVAMPLSGQIATQFGGDPLVARGAALMGSYVGVSGGIFGLAWLARATLRRLKFEAYDRHLGMMLGGTEGALLGIVVTVFLVSLWPSARPPILGSPTGRVVSGLLDRVEPVLPGEVRVVLRPFWDAVGPTVPAAPVPAIVWIAADPIEAVAPGDEGPEPVQIARREEAAPPAPRPAPEPVDRSVRPTEVIGLAEAPLPAEEPAAVAPVAAPRPRVVEAPVRSAPEFEPLRNAGRAGFRRERYEAADADPAGDDIPPPARPRMRSGQPGIVDQGQEDRGTRLIDRLRRGRRGIERVGASDAGYPERR